MASAAAADVAGIVVAAGGPVLLPQALANLRILRGLGCSLPVELFYIGADEMTSTAERMLAAIGVTTVDILTRLPDRLDAYLDRTGLRRYFVLPLAVVASRFARVLLLAADVVPLVDLSPWAHPEGSDGEVTARFWPSPSQPPQVPPDMWTVAGVVAPTCPGCAGLCAAAWEQDSGIVWLDKARCPRGVARLWELVRTPALKAMHEGDQDLFQMAWMWAGCSYELIDHFPGFAGIEGMDGGFQGLATVHRGSRGEPLGVHIHLLKHLEQCAFRSASRRLRENPTIALTVLPNLPLLQEPIAAGVFCTLRSVWKMVTFAYPIANGSAAVSETVSALTVRLHGCAHPCRNEASYPGLTRPFREWAVVAPALAHHRRMLTSLLRPCRTASARKTSDKGALGRGYCLVP